jgi:hypothetical protein
VVIGSWSQANLAVAVKVNTSAASAGVLNMRAERSELLQPAPSQPSGDTKEQLRSRRPFIPTDLVQNTAEYLGRVAGFLSFRGVSTEWQGAVSDAVGFLNSRCWNRLDCSEREYFSPVGFDELWARLRLEDAAVVARCAVLCLRPRLKTVTCGRPSSAWIPLRLLGETNDVLVTLSLHGSLRPVDDLSCLLSCVALRQLSLQGTQVTNESFAGLDRLLTRLHKLDLSLCGQLEAISNLAPATSLRELNLAHSGVVNLGGLEKLVALETLDVTDICAEDLSILQQVPTTGHADRQRGHHHARKYHPRCTAFPRRLPPAHRSSGECSRFAFLIVSASQHRLEV